MNAPLISFVIPARNEGEILATTVAHIDRLAQPFSYEIIVVDDASANPVQLPPRETNRPLKILRNCERKGVAASRRIGCDSAAGKFIFNLDAHVCFSPDTLTSLLAAQELHPRALFGISLAYTEDRLFFESCAFGGNFENVRMSRSFGWKVELTPLPWIVPRIELPVSEVSRTPIAGAAALWMPADLYRELGGFWDGLGGFGNVEDTELCLSAWAMGFEVLLLHKPVCLHYSARSSADVSPGHEHQKYDGNALNAARVARLHLTIGTFLSSGYRDEEISALSSPEYELRTRSLEARRKRSRRAVEEIATDMIERSSHAASFRVLATDHFSATTNYGGFDRILSFSGIARDMLKESLPPSALLELPFLENLDALYSYYRPELWARSYPAEAPRELFRHLGEIGKAHLENIMLQHLAPYWYFEDCLQNIFLPNGETILTVEIDDPLLGFHLRKAAADSRPIIQVKESFPA